MPVESTASRASDLDIVRQFGKRRVADALGRDAGAGETVGFRHHAHLEFSGRELRVKQLHLQRHAQKILRAGKLRLIHGEKQTIIIRAVRFLDDPVIRINGIEVVLLGDRKARVRSRSHRNDNDHQATSYYVPLSADGISYLIHYDKESALLCIFFR